MTRGIDGERAAGVAARDLVRQRRADVVERAGRLVIAITDVEGFEERRQILCVERHIEADELGSFNQCFITGTAAEVTPVSEIGPHRFTVGPIVETLMGDYDAVVRRQKAA